jgi:hypothetical protein
MSLDDAAHVVDDPGLVALLQAYKSKAQGSGPREAFFGNSGAGIRGD